MRWLAIALGVLVGCAIVELAARLLEPSGDPLLGELGDRIEDPILEHRSAPGTGENDARGYRNPRVLERAEVVALGDSQTWGVNAEIDESWPAVMAQLSDRSVYNMARGGYGMLQYLNQLDEAFALDPDWIVIAIYLGNDLHDAYSLAYRLDAHAARRSGDPALRAELGRGDDAALQRLFLDRIAYQRARAGPLRWLQEKTAIGRALARATRRPADTAADRAWAADHPGDGFVYEAGGLSTVFHASYRLAALDVSNPRVREGLRITREALGEAADRIAGKPGARLLVVLLPTKERVFARAVAESGTPVPICYAPGVAHEIRIGIELEAVLDERGVAVLDPLPALEAAVAKGEEIFPPNADGHFTAAGYRVIAGEVARRLAELDAEPRVPRVPR